MLNTYVPNPIILKFEVMDKGKFKSTKHYQLVEQNNKVNVLSEKINIQTDRGFAKSMPKFWLKTRELNKWKRLTGLFKTNIPNLFKGDKGESNSKEDLIIAKFNNPQQDKITIYYFRNYYTSDISKVLKFINT